MSEPWACLCAGCDRVEPSIEAMRSHIYFGHSIERDEQERYVHFALKGEAEFIRQKRERDAERESAAFGRLLDTLRGGDDFIFEAGG